MFRGYEVRRILFSGITPPTRRRPRASHPPPPLQICKAHRKTYLESKYGKVRAGSTNLGDPSRVYVRKAQYVGLAVSVASGCYKALRS